MIEELTKESIKNKINENNNKPIIIDFYGDWCAPCKRFTPVFEKISNEFKMFDFAEYNVDEDEKVLSTKLGIMSVPCMIVFNKGKEIDRITGALSEEALREKIKAVLNKLS